MTLTDGNFAVTDVNGNLLFKVKEPLFSISDKRILLDAYDTPILTLRENVSIRLSTTILYNLHGEAQFFHGDTKKKFHYANHIYTNMLL